MTVIATNTQRSLAELIRSAKELYAEMTKATDRAESIAITLGQTLKEAKSIKPEGETWPNFVRLHFNFSRERADELIRIAGGETTVEKVNERAKKSMRESRAKPVKRFTGSSPTVVQLFDKPKRRKPADTTSGDIHKQITTLYMELKNFSNDYCARLIQWYEAHTDLDMECKAGLVEVLEDSAMSLQRLAQVIDGR